MNGFYNTALTYPIVLNKAAQNKRNVGLEMVKTNCHFKILIATS